MIPALSKLQADLSRFREAYLRGLRMIALISFPIMVGLFVTAEEVVAVVFGPRWAGAAPIFRLLCIVGIWQGIYSATGQVFLAAGRTDRLFRLGMGSSVALVVSFGIGVPWGPLGVAVAYAAGLSVILLPYLAYTYATVGLGLGKVIRQLLGPFLASLTLLPTLWLVKLQLPAHWLPLSRFGVCVVVGAVTFFAAALVVCPSLIRQTGRYAMRSFSSDQRLKAVKADT